MGNLGGFYSIIQTGSRTVCFVDLNIDCISEMVIVSMTTNSGLLTSVLKPQLWDFRSSGCHFFSFCLTMFVL